MSVMRDWISRVMCSKHFVFSLINYLCDASNFSLDLSPQSTLPTLDKPIVSKIGKTNLLFYLQQKKQDVILEEKNLEKAG